MSKDKKKNKKKNKPFPPLQINMKEIVEVAETVLAINPYLKGRALAELVESIIHSLKEAHARKSWFVSTAGWFAMLDVWDDNTFVDLYVSASMAHKKLVSSDPELQAFRRALENKGQSVPHGAGRF